MSGLTARINTAWEAAKTAWRFGAQPPGGQIVRTDPRLDVLQAAVSDNLNFSSLRAMLYAADSGDLAQGLQLFEEMLQKDANLHSVARTRMAALTGLDYEIVSAADLEDVADRELADEAASFVRARFAKIDSFEVVLEHLATAIGSNLAVAELVWEGLKLIDMVPVPPRRLRMEYNEPDVIRVITVDNATGIEAQGPKWIVHVPHSASGYPLTKSILRAQAFVYLTKMLAVADWIVFCEIFGMPIRIAKYQSGATPDEKQELIEMMQNLGSKAFGVFSQAVTLEFVESTQRGTSPFGALIEWCDRTQAKVWLGGNLTADTTGGTGTFAAAAVQDEVRQDLRDDDIQREGQTIRRQLMAPMCAFQFRRDVPLPYFRRIKPEAIDRRMEAETILSAQRAGIRVPLDWAHERVGIPKPEEDEDVLEPSLDAFGEGLTEGMGGAIE